MNALNVSLLLQSVEPYFASKHGQQQFPLSMTMVNSQCRTHHELLQGVKVSRCRVSRHRFSSTKFKPERVDSYDLNEWSKPNGNTYEDSVWTLQVPPFPSLDSVIGVSIEAELPLQHSGLPLSLWWLTRDVEGAQEWEVVLNGKTLKKNNKKTVEMADVEVDLLEVNRSTHKPSLRRLHFVDCSFDAAVLHALSQWSFLRLVQPTVKEVHFNNCTMKFDKALLNPNHYVYPDSSDVLWNRLEGVFFHKCGSEALWRAVVPLLLLPVKKEGEEGAVPVVDHPIRIFSVVDCVLRKDTLESMLKSLSQRNQYLFQRNGAVHPERYGVQQYDFSQSKVDWALSCFTPDCWTLYQDLKIYVLTMCRPSTEELLTTFAHWENLSLWFIDDRWNIEFNDEVLRFLMGKNIKTQSIRNAGTNLTAAVCREFSHTVWP